jgi:hypothetical protein
MHDALLIADVRAPMNVSVNNSPGREKKDGNRLLR